MTMLLEDIYKAKTLLLDDWEEYKNKNRVTDDNSGAVLKNTNAIFYRKTIEGREQTVGVFYHQGELAFLAWGYSDESHCSAHMVYINGTFSQPFFGCPQIAIPNDGSFDFKIKTSKEVYEW